eukprot:TRINITY_DN9393_c0_g2_i2.p1 TRINITY_DN9393_c0_g2~~TRINITY_DN9393_c0_g2_i2.p1  ORF type:complete len:790 (+),score=198.30 TRINITY_DN9393_c0_g2_i2:263-2371(+)
MVPWVNTLTDEAAAQVEQLQQQAEFCMENGHYDMMEQIVNCASEFQDTKTRIESWKAAAGGAGGRSRASQAQTPASSASTPARAPAPAAAPPPPAMTQSPQSPSGSQDFSRPASSPSSAGSPQAKNSLSASPPDPSPAGQSPWGLQSAAASQFAWGQGSGSQSPFSQTPAASQTPWGQTPAAAASQSPWGQTPAASQSPWGQGQTPAAGSQSSWPATPATKAPDSRPQLPLQSPEQALHSAIAAVNTALQQPQASNLRNRIAALRAAISEARSRGLSTQQLPQADALLEKAVQAEKRLSADGAADEAAELYRQEQLEQQEQAQTAQLQQQQYVQRQEEMLRKSISIGNPEKISQAIDQARSAGVAESLLKDAEQQMKSLTDRRSQGAKILHAALENGANAEQLELAVDLAQAAGVDIDSCILARKVMQNRRSAHDSVDEALKSRDLEQIRKVKQLVESAGGPATDLERLRRVLEPGVTGEVLRTTSLASEPGGLSDSELAAFKQREEQLLQRLRQARERQLSKIEQLQPQQPRMQQPVLQEAWSEPKMDWFEQEKARTYEYEIKRQQQQQLQNEEWQKHNQLQAEEDARWKDAYRNARERVDQVRSYLNSFTTAQGISAHPGAGNHLAKTTNPFGAAQTPSATMPFQSDTVKQAFNPFHQPEYDHRSMISNAAWRTQLEPARKYEDPNFWRLNKQVPEIMHF